MRFALKPYVSDQEAFVTKPLTLVQAQWKKVEAKMGFTNHLQILDAAQVSNSCIRFFLLFLRYACTGQTFAGYREFIQLRSRYTQEINIGWDFLTCNLTLTVNNACFTMSSFHFT